MDSLLASKTIPNADDAEIILTTLLNWGAYECAAEYSAQLEAAAKERSSTSKDVCEVQRLLSLCGSVRVLTCLMDRCHQYFQTKTSVVYDEDDDDVVMAPPPPPGELNGTECQRCRVLCQASHVV